MKIRERSLPVGWYPETEREVRAVFDGWSAGGYASDDGAISVVVPHAGWAFSGELAFHAFQRVTNEVDVFVVAGGHLRPNDMVHVQAVAGFETPLGVVKGNTAIIEALVDSFSAVDDDRVDNTVEVHLPIIAALFPKASVAAIRVPPSSVANRVGASIAQWARETNSRVAVAGSTDLTHYGPNYGMTDHGPARSALEWVKSENDAGFIERMLKLDIDGAISWANEQRAACSAGGAAVAASFASNMGVSRGSLLEYATSYDVARAESFVGYATILYGI